MKITNVNPDTVNITFEKTRTKLRVYEMPSSTVELKIEMNIMHVIEINNNGKEILFDGRRIYPETKSGVTGGQPKINSSEQSSEGL